METPPSTALIAENSTGGTTIFLPLISAIKMLSDSSELKKTTERAGQLETQSMPLLSTGKTMSIKTIPDLYSLARLH